MSSNREQFTTEIFVNNEQAQDATAKLTAKLEKQTQTYERLRAELGDFDKKTLKAKKSMEDTQASLDHAKTGVETYRKAIENLSDRSISQLVKMQKQLKRELDKTKPNTEEWKRLSKEYQQVTGRIESLKKAQQGVVKEGDKSATAFGRFFKKVNDFYGGITIYAKAIKVALQAVIAVTKQVVNASQTMSDKWNNGMEAMKTTTDAFFMALATGDWSAFNNGLSEALKKARELAELKDLLGSFDIAGGYMQAKYRVDFTSNMTEATNTDNDAAKRQEALDAAKEALEAQREFTEREAEATFKALQAMFDSWKGITFESQEEFEDFFDELFRNVTTTGSDAFNEAKDYINGLVAEMTQLHVEGDLIYSDYTKSEAMTIALEKATEKYGAKMVALYKAAELSDEKQRELIQTYAKWRGDLQRIDQDEKTYNKTRDRVIKQIKEQGAAVDVIIADIDAWAAQEKQAALERYLANKASFDSIAEAYREYQAELAAIDAKAEADRQAAREAEEARLKAEAEKRRQEQQAAADKAYQNAIKRLEKQESEQKLIWKRQYAAGLIDKQTYEAQIALIEESFLKQKMETAMRYGKETDQFMNLLLDRQIARLQKSEAMLKEEMEEMARYYDQLNEDDYNRFGKGGSTAGSNGDEAAREAFLAKKVAEIRASITEESAMERYETEMKWLNKLHKDGLISDQEFGQAELNMKLGFAAKIAQEVNRYAQMASDFATNLKEFESAKLEEEYQRQLTAAGNNAEEREAIDADYEKKKLDLQKKYADTEMVINIAKAIAAGALAAIEAFAAAGNPILGAVFAAIIAATTALEVATIVKQRNAIKNASASGGGGAASAPSTGQRTITGHAEGGYTENHTTLSTVGEEGVEWIAPHWMVRDNPTTFANLEHYRKTGSHGRSGSISRGFADGGYTGKVADDLSKGMSTADIEAAVEAAIIKSMATGAIRAYLVRNDLTEIDNQDARFKDIFTL